MYPTPTSANPEEEFQQGPKRTPRACDSCYKRKIKCDAAVPRCNWCSHHNIPCTFERTVRRRRKEKNNAFPQQKTSRLAERIDRIEKLLTDNLFRESGDVAPQGSPTNASNYSPETPPQPSSFTQSSVSSSVPLHFAGRELGVVSLITGIPFLLPEGQEWIQSRTGQPVAFDKLSPARPPWEKRRALNSNALLMDLQTAFELPGRAVVELNYEVYSTSLMQRVFPIIDPVLFKNTIAAAYQHHHTNNFYGQAAVRACVFAFMAFASLTNHNVPNLHERTTMLPPIDPERFTLKAQYLFPQVLQEATTLEGLQAATMIAIYELMCGNLQSANYYGAIAARMIFMLGAHTAAYSPEIYLQSQANDLEARKHCHLRNVFWLCYTIEKDVCLRTGQPQLFSDENCDLTLPPGYVEKLYTSMDSQRHSPELSEHPLFPVDLRLSIIKARAYSALYSFKALQRNDAELIKEIRELDAELERWRTSVPPEWRPTLSFSQETPDPNVSMHSVMLRMNYHLCMTIIHQASSRCKSWAKGGSGVMDGVSSSLELSVEASRSTLLYLEAAEHVLVDGVFWTLIFYPMSALLAIFCNILQNPAVPQATKDLGLLKTATTMMERVFLRQGSSAKEIAHIRLVADFVTELYRLAKCAIDKARSERMI